MGAGVSYGLARLRKPPETRDVARRVYNVEVYEVAPVNLQEIINGFGTAVPDKEVVLSSQVAGEVTEIHQHLKVGLKVRGIKSESLEPAASSKEEESSTVDEVVNTSTTSPEATGASPTSGPTTADTLVRIDPSTYSERVLAARHRLDEDEAELRRLDQELANLDRVREKIDADFKDATREYQKTQQLREKGINTDSDLRRAVMELRQHEKNIVANGNDRDLLPLRRELVQKRMDAHRSDLKLSELDMERTQIRSPFDGVVSAVQVEKGQYVRIGEPLVTITSVDVVDVPIALPLEDYSRILPDVRERNYPTVDLAENETAAPKWKGTLTRVSPKVDELTRTVLVYVRVHNREQETPLLPGTFVHARISGPILKQVKVIPRDALPAGKAFVEQNGIVFEKSITLSRTIHGLVLVDSGINAGDRIILTNHDILFDGAHVIAKVERKLDEELARQRIRTARLVSNSLQPAADAP